MKTVNIGCKYNNKKKKKRLHSKCTRPDFVFNVDG